MTGCVMFDTNLSASVGCQASHFALWNTSKKNNVRWDFENFNSENFDVV